MQVFHLSNRRTCISGEATLPAIGCDHLDAFGFLPILLWQWLARIVDYDDFDIGSGEFLVRTEFTALARVLRSMVAMIVDENMLGCPVGQLVTRYSLYWIGAVNPEIQFFRESQVLEIDHNRMIE